MEVGIMAEYYGPGLAIRLGGLIVLMTGLLIFSSLHRARTHPRYGPFASY
jgi:hypothetical protein